MSVYAIGATSLIGGAAGSLDSVYVNANGSDPWSGAGETPGIHNGDPAFVTVQGDKVYHYIANSTSGAAESSPDVIKPDNASAGVPYTGDLRWILHKTYGVDEEFTTAEKAKLAAVEALADVTDIINVTAAGALMNSEVDANIKTLVIPASTTISAFGATLTDDADAATARTTLGLGSASERTAEDTLTDGANLPDGAAIKAYGDANWSGGGGGSVDISGTPVANDFARFTDANTIEGRGYTEVKSDLSLDNVENTAHSSDAHTMTIDGRDVAADGLKLDGIEASAKDDQSAAEVPIADAGGLITGTNVETALQENRTAINLNTAKTTNATHTGDVTGNVALTIAEDAVDIAMLSATGTANSGTYLRGDNTWATPAGSGDVSKIGTPVNNQVGVWTGDGTIEGNVNLTFDGSNLSVGGNVDGRDISADGTKLDTVETSADVTDAVNIGTSIHGATAKTTPVDADTVPVIDSAASNVLKKVTWANVKATLKTYFDTLYNLYVHPNHSGDVTSVGDGVQTIANDAVTYAKMQNVVANDRMLGRVSGAGGVVEELTKTQVLTMLNVEDGAEANNISDANAMDLTDGGDTGLHSHPQSGIGIYSGTGVFAGTTGDTISIGSTLAGTTYRVSITPTGANSEDVGAIWVDGKSTTQFVVKNTGSSVIDFDYIVIDAN